MRIRSACLVSGLALAGLGCVGQLPDTPTHPDALLGHRFESSSTIVSGYPYANALDFYDNGLGIEGCNSTVFDQWSVNDGVLAIARGEQGWTLMSCPPDQESRDHSFASFLGSWPVIAMTTDGFTLTSGSTAIEFVLADQD